jgi:hypothetical protein
MPPEEPGVCNSVAIGDCVAAISRMGAQGREDRYVVIVPGIKTWWRSEGRGTPRFSSMAGRLLDGTNVSGRY